MNDRELEILLNDLESDRVERKASVSDRNVIRQAVCAFANDLPNHQQAGVLFIGVNNDGSCANLPITDQLLLTLSDMRSDGNILPFPSIIVQKRTISGCELAVAIVEASDASSVRFNGRVWVRVGPRRATATLEEERRLAEKRRSKDLPFDLRPILLMDLGPNLGAINRAALIAADYVVVPLSPDLFSLQGLRNLGPTLRRWRENWKDRLTRNPAEDLELPKGRMQPVGYVVLQHSVRLDRPVKAYNRWIARIPTVYRDAVLAIPGDNGISVADDPHCLALLKNYQSLMPMAQEARKPMFHLKPADGAIGAHTYAVKNVYRDFEALACKIAEQTGVKKS